MHLIAEPLFFFSARQRRRSADLGEASAYVTNNKIDRRILGCLLFSLVLAVAGREAPEFVNLTDDVSNDGTVASSVQQAVPQVSPRRLIPDGTVRYTNSRLPSFASLQSSDSIPTPASRSGQKLLRLLSLQRK